MYHEDKRTRIDWGKQIWSSGSMYKMIAYKMIVRGKENKRGGLASPGVRDVPTFYEVMGQPHLSRHPECYPLLGKIVVQSWCKIV